MNSLAGLFFNKSAERRLKKLPRSSSGPSSRPFKIIDREGRGRVPFWDSPEFLKGTAAGLSAGIPATSLVMWQLSHPHLFGIPSGDNPKINSSIEATGRAMDSQQSQLPVADQDALYDNLKSP